LTILDPNTALVVIDLQKGVQGIAPAALFDPVVANSRRLAEAFRTAGLPVVLVNVDAVAPGRTEQGRRLPAELPEGFAELVPALGARPDDIRITKKSWGAFAHTDLEARLRALGVTQIVLTGVATASGVESTARQAYEAGFNVTLAVDAMADMRPEAHAASIDLVFPRLGETGTTDAILALLAART
jgi:nicotinamidase-related amidase